MALFDLTQAPTTDPLSIYRYRDGLYATDLLAAALVWLDLFTWLETQPSNIPEICRHFQIHERPTDVMITLFKAMGLLEERDQRPHDEKPRRGAQQHRPVTHTPLNRMWRNPLEVLSWWGAGSYVHEVVKGFAGRASGAPGLGAVARDVPAGNAATS